MVSVFSEKALENQLTVSPTVGCSPIPCMDKLHVPVSTPPSLVIMAEILDCWQPLLEEYLQKDNSITYFNHAGQF